MCYDNIGDNMNLNIYCTRDNVKSYPMHKHSVYEIIMYTEGNGMLCTDNKKYPFSKGTIIIVPPGIEHASSSTEKFKNISVDGDFQSLFHISSPIVISDTPNKEGESLAKMIYNNRFANEDFVKSLCSAYIHFILQNTKFENNITSAVNMIVQKITDNFSDCHLNIESFLTESGYAEDYIRTKFKQITGKSPVKFLTDIRIRHACFLMEIYSNTLSMEQISYQCGYMDYVYFSKKFKTVTGMSPKNYIASANRQ